MPIIMGMDKKNKFAVIKGGKDTGSDTCHHGKDWERLYCHRCNVAGRISTGQFIEVSSSVYHRDNEVKTGVKKLACLDCMVNGEKVFLTV